LVALNTLQQSVQEARLVANRSPQMALEVTCWAVGLLLLALFFGARAGLENQRQQGVQFFVEARAAAGQQAVDQPVADVGSAVEASEPATDEQNIPIALLRIPRLDLEVPVYRDSSEFNLNRGAGWVEGTAAPNNNGNMAIAAHRDQHFRPLKDIVVGDILELESLSRQGNYQVTSLSIVEPQELWPLDPTDESTVTLITCYPFYFVGNAPLRYIVQAVAMN
jgi:sortase A